MVLVNSSVSAGTFYCDAYGRRVFGGLARAEVLKVTYADPNVAAEYRPMFLVLL